jgi:hypothetical protein
MIDQLPAPDSAEHVLQHGTIQRQVGDRLLQLAVLILELTQTLHLRRHQTGVLLAPIVEGCFGNPDLAANFANGRAVLSLLSTKAICASENFDAFMVNSVLRPMPQNWNFPA